MFSDIRGQTSQVSCLKIQIPCPTSVLRPENLYITPPTRMTLRQLFQEPHFKNPWTKVQHCDFLHGFCHSGMLHPGGSLVVSFFSVASLWVPQCLSEDVPPQLKSTILRCTFLQQIEDLSGAEFHNLLEASAVNISVVVITPRLRVHCRCSSLTAAFFHGIVRRSKLLSSCGSVFP